MEEEGGGRRRRAEEGGQEQRQWPGRANSVIIWIRFMGSGLLSGFHVRFPMINQISLMAGLRLCYGPVWPSFGPKYKCGKTVNTKNFTMGFQKECFFFQGKREIWEKKI